MQPVIHQMIELRRQARLQRFRIKQWKLPSRLVKQFERETGIKVNRIGGYSEVLGCRLVVVD